MDERERLAAVERVAARIKVCNAARAIARKRLTSLLGPGPAQVWANDIVSALDAAGLLVPELPALPDWVAEQMGGE